MFPAGHLDVSMAATNLENQLHSAQKNLLFLQREHASTLKGLHAEIRRLQQHCTGTGGPSMPPPSAPGRRAKQDLLSGLFETAAGSEAVPGLLRRGARRDFTLLSDVLKPTIAGVPLRVFLHPLCLIDTHQA